MSRRSGTEAESRPPRTTNLLVVLQVALSLVLLIGSGLMIRSLRALYEADFGFERDKYPISRAIGERVLLPAIREAAPETLIVSDGFSCREQIAQLAGRRAFHFAEVLKLAATQAQLTT